MGKGERERDCYFNDLFFFRESVFDLILKREPCRC